MVLFGAGRMVEALRDVDRPVDPKNSKAAGGIFEQETQMPMVGLQAQSPIGVQNEALDFAFIQDSKMTGKSTGRHSTDMADLQLGGIFEQETQVPRVGLQAQSPIGVQNEALDFAFIPPATDSKAEIFDRLTAAATPRPSRGDPDCGELHRQDTDGRSRAASRRVGSSNLSVFVVGCFGGARRGERLRFAPWRAFGGRTLA
jgi:hypothetical protein